MNKLSASAAAAKRTRSAPDSTHWPQVKAAELIGPTFSEQLLCWYDRRARDLPWRRDSDPYRIWVSEIMLQQTRVETVIPYYEKFLRSFPDVETLAHADEQLLLSHWSGLGYYSRARNLQKGARYVLEQHQGRFPRDRAAALLVPGVGPYTSAAILSIAYGEAHPVVDGNVIRVLSRLLLIGPPLCTQPTRLEQIAAVLLDDTRSGDHNQAMMELGATVCLPKQPTCLVCPVATHCQAFQEARTSEFPPPRPRPKTRDVECAILWLRDAEGRYLFRMGWPLLPHLWMPPILTLADTASPARANRKGPPEATGAVADWLNGKGFSAQGSPRITGTFRHAITTRKLRFQVVEIDLSDHRPGSEDLNREGNEEEAWFLDEARVGLGRSSVVDKALRLRSDNGS